MVSEAQFRKWRDDITTNLKKATEGDTVALEAAKLAATVIHAERISELSQALASNSNIVSALSDDLDSSLSILETLVWEESNYESLSEDTLSRAKVILADNGKVVNT